MKKNYIQIIVLIEVQIALVVMFFLMFNISDLDKKLRNTNVFIHGIFQSKQFEVIQSVSSEDIVIGSEDAQCTIIMYTKYGCSACEDFFSKTYPKLKSKYINNGHFKFVIRYLTHEKNVNSFYATKSAKFAYDNNLFDEFNEALLLYEFDKLDTLSLREIVLSTILDSARFDEYITKKSLIKQLSSNAFEARTVGINKTPTFIINGEKLVGNRRFEKIEELIQLQIDSKACD